MNADLSYHPETKTYRLYITEIDHGLLVLEFSHDFDAEAITILETHVIDIPAMLTKHKFAKPYDATFQAVTLARADFNPTLKKSTDVVIVTTGVYHTLQL